MKKNILKVIAAMLALSIVFVACSDSKDDKKDDKKTETTTTKKAMSTEGSMTKDDSKLSSGSMSDEAKSIAEIAAGNPEASTAVSLVQQAGLADLIASEGTLTLFTPTNDAFKKVDPATLAALQANPDALLQVLKYHALATEVLLSKDLTDGKVITTAEGSKLTVNVKDGDII